MNSSVFCLVAIFQIHYSPVYPLPAYRINYGNEPVLVYPINQDGWWRYDCQHKPGRPGNLDGSDVYLLWIRLLASRVADFIVSNSSNYLIERNNSIMIHNSSIEAGDIFYCALTALRCRRRGSCTHVTFDGIEQQVPENYCEFIVVGCCKVQLHSLCSTILY